MNERPPDSLEMLIDRMDSVGRERKEVSVDNVLDSIGRRSFSPILTVCGLIMVLPIIGDIPGMSILLGSIVLLVSVQLLLHQDHLWLPKVIRRRSLKGSKLSKGACWLRRPARFVDKWTKPRLRWAVRHAGVYLIASVCVLIAATTPLLELVPFSANLAGLAITALGLALFAEDGYLAIAAIGIVAATVALVASSLL